MQFAISSFVTLLVVVDPVGLVPAFLSVTRHLDSSQKRQVAIRASVIAAALLALTALGGNWLLDQLRISIPAFQIAGGLLLFTVGFRMVFGEEPKQQESEADKALQDRVTNIAAFPLAIPLMAGPGALTATLLLSGRADRDALAVAVLLLAIVVTAAICAVSFMAADRITRLLGITGNVVLSRVLGVILAAFAVQFVIDGIKAL